MEEEISLRELIEVLFKWKGMIIGVTVVAVVLAIIFSFFILEEEYVAVSTMKINPPIALDLPQNISYQDSSKKNIVVQVPYRTINVTEKIDFEVVDHEIKNPDFLKKVALKINQNLDPGALMNLITLEKKPDTDIFTIKGVSNDPKIAMDIVNSVASELSKHLTAIIDADQEETLKVLAAQISCLEQRIHDLENHSSADTKVELIKEQSRKESLENIYIGLVAKHQEVQTISMLSENSQPISLISPANQPAHAVKPRKKLNVAVAFLLGLMAGVFMALFREYWANTSGQSKMEMTS